MSEELRRPQFQSREIEDERGHWYVVVLEGVRPVTRIKIERPWGRGEVQRFRRCAGPKSLGIHPINTSPFLAIYTTPNFSPHQPHHLFFSFSRCPAPLCGNILKMRWYLALLVSALVATVTALSSSGSRLLVVLDDTTDKSAYSILWSDLEGN